MTTSIVICIVGLLLHGALKWDEWRKLQNGAGKSGSLKKYLSFSRSQTAVSVLATGAAYMVTNEMGWMDPGMALACGYMGNSVAENLANKFARKQEG